MKLRTSIKRNNKLFKAVHWVLFLWILIVPAMIFEGVISVLFDYRALAQGIFLTHNFDYFIFFGYGLSVIYIIVIKVIKK